MDKKTKPNTKQKRNIPTLIRVITNEKSQNMQVKTSNYHEDRDLSILVEKNKRKGK